MHIKLIYSIIVPLYQKFPYVYAPTRLLWTNRLKPCRDAIRRYDSNDQIANHVDNNALAAIAEYRSCATSYRSQ